MKTNFFSRYLILLMGLILFSSLTSNAQTFTGVVKDADSNDPIPGVSVTVKGSSKGVLTNASGEFTLNGLDEKSSLVFSFVGFLTQEIQTGNKSQILVLLKQDSKSLDEVVVVGYGTVKKSDLTGSLTSVKAKEINAFPTTNVLQALSGRASGVQVIQNTGSPGGAVSVRIRGTNSVQGSNEPLYVVDGFPSSGSNPTILNNTDIESIEILKDASATAIYGSRGANGVVLITTKQGKAGKVQVDYEGSYSVQTLRKNLDLTKTVELLSNEVVAYQDANQTLVNELRNLEILVERYLKIEVMHFLSFFKFFLIGLN
jgi:TonB-dependent SusC/RagA subfamily outer membrane receptor